MHAVITPIGYRVPGGVLSATRTGPSTRAALLDSSRVAFSSRGYAAVSVDDIANGAGVTRTAFYRYFAGKADVVRLFTEQLVVEVSAIFSEINELDLAQARALQGWLDRLLSSVESSGWVIACWSEAQAGDPQVRAITLANTDRVVTLLGGRLRALQASSGGDRRRRSGPTADSVALVLNAQLQGLLQYWFYLHGQLDRRDQIKAFALSWSSTIASWLDS